MPETCQILSFLPRIHRHILNIPYRKDGVLSGVKKDLRELHIEMGLKTYRPEVDSALSLMKISEKIGIQNESRVLGKKHNELLAFYRKMWSRRSNTGNMPVPAEFSYIFES